MAVVRRAGIRDKYVALFRGPQTPGDSDGFAEALNPANVWAAIQPLPPDGLEDRTTQFLVTIDYHSQVTCDSFLTYNARTFYVKGVQNVDEKNVEMRLMCHEVTP